MTIGVRATLVETSGVRATLTSPAPSPTELPGTCKAGSLRPWRRLSL
jgi:hypothetical protein